MSIPYRKGRNLLQLELPGNTVLPVSIPYRKGRNNLIAMESVDTYSKVSIPYRKGRNWESYCDKKMDYALSVNPL